MTQRLPLTILLALASMTTYGQCSHLSTTISVDFSADGTCAPVTVNTFEVTYTFNAAQDPANIEVEFRWNDPANTVEVVSGAALTVTNANRTFQATATAFPYPDTGPECFFEAQAFIIVDGDECETSEQTQIVPSWNVDNENGAEIAFNPNAFNICENTALTNVVFEDASIFNCNINDNPDNPNQISRWTQFVYGTNGAPAIGRIRDLTVDDGGVVPITDNDGDFVSPETRGTGAVMVTAGYFGAVEEVGFPADIPIYETFPISAPANVANVVGTTFQITLYNWNTCNPFNGDQDDPNYEEAVSETLVIEVIDPPAPDFQTREENAAGPIETVFCINEDIFFENLTGGPFNYTWHFYDGNMDTDPVLATSNEANPTFQYTAGGDKLVRLIANDPNADGVCEVIYDAILTLSPDAVADFVFFDQTFTSTIDPLFCQTGSDLYTVGFRDNTTLVPNTELRYEFFIEGNPPTSGTPDFTFPADGSYVDGVNVDDFTLDFATEEFVIARLEARNTATACGSFKQDTIFVYGRSQPDFSFNAACSGEVTTFSSIADPVLALTNQVNGDLVDLYEWDFSYDGVTFNPELTVSDNSNFDQLLGSSGTYEVALRMTTQKGNCSDVVSFPVTVNPNPDSQLASDTSSDLCPGDIITFTNNSVNTDPTDYVLQVNHFPSLTSFTMNLTEIATPLSFDNPDDTTRTYVAQVLAISVEGCETISSGITFRVSPDEEAEIFDPNYSFFDTNCSLWTSTMEVSAETILLDAEQYTWTLQNNGEIYDGYPITTLSSNPNFNTFDYVVENTSNTIMTYQMVLEAAKTGICIASDTFNLQISPQPVADFTMARADECEDVVFSLEANQKGLADYDWQFDPVPDQQFGGDDLIEVSYSRNENGTGDFNVTITLITTNLGDCQSSPNIAIELIEEEKPEIVADFAIDPTELQLPDNTVTITNNSTSTVATTYLWDFGDGTTSTAENPGTHQYNQFGTYQITLEVTDEFCTIEASQAITVFPAAPILDFEADTLEGCAPLTVQFTNLSQFAVPGAFLWEFGDGSISRSDNPTHTFFQDGSFSIRLRGENEVGETSEIQRDDYITVYGRPFADFLVSARVVYIPDQEAIFKNLSENATNFFWDFGDGTTSDEESPSHAFTEEGFYDITLVASNDFGCVDTLFRAAEVEAISGGQVNTPNAFTPNLSGSTGGEVSPGGEVDPSQINDIFLPRLEGVERFRMFIYNKWGELIFESSSQTKGWDGYYKNRLAPAGVYVYKLELRFSDGQDVVRVGDVTLIR